MKRLRAEVYLRYYNKELTIKEFEHFYELLKYDNNGNDPKKVPCRRHTHPSGPTNSHPRGIPSSVKSLRLVIKNRVKTYMKTRTKKLKACSV
jgi:hypothetical protein